jgi:hypothetical protein
MPFHLIIYVYLYAIILDTFIYTMRRWSNLYNNKFHGEQRFFWKENKSEWINKEELNLFFLFLYIFFNYKKWVRKPDL